MAHKAAWARQRPNLKAIPSRIELPGGYSVRVWTVRKSTMAKGLAQDEEVPCATWDCVQRIVRLRRDRTHEQRVDDLGHEFVHVALDWWNWALKKDRPGVRP